MRGDICKKASQRAHVAWAAALSLPACDLNQQELPERCELPVAPIPLARTPDKAEPI